MGYFILSMSGHIKIITILIERRPKLVNSLDLDEVYLDFFTKVTIRRHSIESINIMIRGNKETEKKHE